MKKLIILIAGLGFASCGTSNKEEQKIIKEIVCADSVEQAMFDENGNEILVRVPGPCDTIFEGHNH
jgi:hypothetical protein